MFIDLLSHSFVISQRKKWGTFYSYSNVKKKMTRFAVHAYKSINWTSVA